MPSSSPSPSSRSSIARNEQHSLSAATSRSSRSRVSASPRKRSWCPPPSAMRASSALSPSSAISASRRLQLVRPRASTPRSSLLPSFLSIGRLRVPPAWGLNRGRGQGGRVDMDTELSIGQLAERSGISVSAIRYYERRGLLPEPERVGGQRRYAETTIRRLGMIDTGKRAGFSLEEIRALLAATDEGRAGEQAAARPGGAQAARGRSADRARPGDAGLAGSRGAGAAARRSRRARCSTAPASRPARSARSVFFGVAFGQPVGMGDLGEVRELVLVGEDEGRVPFDLLQIGLGQVRACG